MERQFNACQTPCSMYLSIFNSFRVIPCLNQCVSPKIAIFTTFWFPLGTPLGQSRLRSSTKFEVCRPSRSEDTARLVCQLSIYNSFPVIRTTIAKNVIFTYPGLHFCLPWGRPCGNHAKRCMNEKTIQCLPNPCSMYPSVFNSFPVIRTSSAKSRRFHVPQPTFLFPLDTPLRLSRNMLHGLTD